ncbi:hypothetical protein [Nocardioides yefusunii]|uniref:Helix-turn-helix transcriptional regulator n=1 Tax=Nocardioides yefusunii TaxID=2500546 RepID=A0ABW1QWI8_9ACTN|nr:hypothetical protein [Nocardioides yefusunii]
MARTTTPDAGDTRLQAMAARLESSAAHLSRIETGQRRDSFITQRFEQALGLPDGALWAPTAILCRAHPEPPLKDTCPLPAETDVRTVSGITERLLDPTATVTGGEWVRWARTIGVPGNVGLPVPLFEQIVRRLASEAARSVSHALPARYEALSMLRCSHYGDLVLDVARQTVNQPHAHGTELLASAAGKRVDAEAVKWSLGLLGAERTALHGALGLESLGQIGGNDFWEGLTAPLLTVFDDAAPGSDVERWATHVMRLVPRDAWRRLGENPSRPLPASESLDDWTRSSENPAWRWCLDHADDITGPLGVGNQPMLARLLFEIVFGPWEARAASAVMVLSALPQLSATIAGRMVELAGTHPDCPARDRIVRRISNFRHDAPVPGLDLWISATTPTLRASALTVAGTTGHPVPTDVLRTALLDPDTTQAARYAAGMNRSSDLADLVADATLPDETRAELAWWHARGGRIAE